MDFSDLESVAAAIAQLWGTAGHVGPILSIALGVMALVALARTQLTQWIPWLATRHGALALVGLFASVGSAALAALAGETSVLTILVQAVAGALTAIGIRSGLKAAKTGGAAEATGWLEDGSEVTYLRHEHVRAPTDYATHPERYEVPPERR